jgi:hypothetical protein
MNGSSWGIGTSASAQQGFHHGGGSGAVCTKLTPALRLLGADAAHRVAGCSEIL